MSDLTALQILQQFNLVDYTNFSSGADVEGRAVIGGNLTAGHRFLNPSGGSSDFPR
jgi:hypothetical protein